MSIQSMMRNFVDLYVMNPAQDSSYGSAPVPGILTSGIRCSVQPMSDSMIEYWQAQNRINVSHDVFFAGDIGIEVTGTTPTKSYRFTWTDPPTGPSFLSMLRYKEATLGHFLVYQAVCLKLG